ncbi:MAG: hypothetical protein M1835_000608 [Candelina submexicana]|nr:MAG: hypothetical protein M1835_000608 [Candelina submexicana]
MVAIIPNAASARPSLFATIFTIRATIRLAKITAAFKRELRARVREPRDDPLGFRNRQAFKGRVYRSLDKVLKPSHQRRIYRQGAVEDDAFVEGLVSLLKELDENSGILTSPLNKIVADRGYLVPEAVSHLKAPVSISWARAAYEYDLVTLLLLAIDRRIELLNTGRKICHNDGLDLEILSDEVCTANLQHFLLCLQRRLFDVLLRKSFIEIEEHAHEWQRYSQQQRKLGVWWFSEWPSGRRPLSTTWPWNIKPSLVVLWGVCWMFYGDEWNPSIPADNILRSEAFWEYMPQMLPDSNEAVVDHELNSTTIIPNYGNVPISPSQRTSFIDVLDASVESDITAPQWHSSPGPQSTYRNRIHGSPIQGSSTVEYITTSEPSTLYGTSDSSQNDFSEYNIALASRSSGAFLSYVHALAGSFTHPPAESPFNPPIVTFQAPTPPDAASPVAWNPLYNLESSQAFGRDSAFSTLNDSNTILHDMHNNHQPHDFRRSPVPSSIQPQKHSVSPDTPTDSLSHEAETSPTSIISDERKGPERGGSQPPRNGRNRFTCIHEDCTSEKQVFLRRCEWRKHMDKHERPYRCKMVGCEKLQGFTYSGGLLRHEREVHKKHGGPKERMMCPYPDCKRSSGVGFTRKENLNEHKRRVHRNSGEIKPEELDGEAERSEEDVVDAPRKRKRSLISEWSISAGEGGDDDGLRSSKVLRLEQERYADAKKFESLHDRLSATESTLLSMETRLRTSEETIGELRRLLAARRG